MKLPLLFAATLLAAAAASSAGCATQGDVPRNDETTASASPPASAPAVQGTLASSGGSATHAAAAAESLKTLVHLVTPQKTLGFASADEAASASLAAPLPMLMVRLDDLQAYRAGDDPRPLLKDEGSVLYPVAVGGEVRSSVVVRKINGEWKGTQFGRANLAKFAHEGRTRVAAARGVATAGVSFVEIPAIAARMLGHEENGVPMLTALLDLPGTDVRAGSTLPAADVFAKLQPVAARTDRMAPN